MSLLYLSLTNSSVHVHSAPRKFMVFRVGKRSMTERMVILLGWHELQNLLHLSQNGTGSIISSLTKLCREKGGRRQEEEMSVFRKCRHENNHRRRADIEPEFLSLCWKH
jgi:hypothetical protein